jgi:hypothetical protein
MLSVEEKKKRHTESQKKWLSKRLASDPDYAIKIRDRKRNWQKNNYSSRLLYVKELRKDPLKWARYIRSQIKFRCDKNGIPFDLSKEDFERLIPSDGLCPVLGIELSYGKGRLPTSASVDRLIPSLGYVKGNVCIMSVRANLIKQDCIDPDELRKVADFLERKLLTIKQD